MAGETDILKWVAGGDCEPPDGKDADVDALKDLLAKHRLVERLLCRVGSHRLPWCQPDLVAWLVVQRAAARAGMRAQCAALHEIQAALQSTHELSGCGPLVVVKGFSLYAETGELRHLHLCDDVDIFCNEPEPLLAVLESLGYAGERFPEYRHELAAVCRDGLTLELHRFIRTFQFPGNAIGANFAPAENPGCWFQPFAVPTKGEIPYGALANHCIRGSTAETSGLTFLDPTASALVLCAHLFMDYTAPPEVSALPIRLGELADVMEYTGRPTFDHRVFAELAHVHGVEDAAALVGHLCGEYFGCNPLRRIIHEHGARAKTNAWESYLSPSPPVSGGVARYEPGWVSWFPRRLEWHGGLACLNTLDDLLLPLDAYQVSERLIPNEIGASATGCQGPMRIAARCSTRDGACVGVGRSIVTCPGDDSFDFDLVMTISDTALRLNVSILGDDEPSYLITLTTPDPDIGAGISVNLRNMHAVYCNVYGIVTMEASVRRGACDVSISIDVTALRLAFGASGSCPLRLCVEQWDRLATVRAVPPDVHILVPIHVVLSHNATVQEGRNGS